MPTTDRCHLLPYPSEVNRATLICASNCGPIHLSYSLGTEAARNVYFRPDAPVYNIQNSVAAGQVILPLQNLADQLDVVAVTFTNNSTRAGSVSLKVALNFAVASNQQRLDFADNLQPQESLTVHIVFNRP